MHIRTIMVLNLPITQEPSTLPSFGILAMNKPVPNATLFTFMKNRCPTGLCLPLPMVLVVQILCFLEPYPHLRFLFQHRLHQTATDSMTYLACKDLILKNFRFVFSIARVIWFFTPMT